MSPPRRLTDEQRIANNREAQRRWREKNPEKMRECRIAWLAKHPNYHRELAARNPEKAREKRREYSRRYLERHPEKERARWLKRYRENQERERERTRAYRTRAGEAGKQREREYNRRYQYGLTPEAYVEMFEAQDGRCAICGIRFEEVMAKMKKPCVDHNHTTGKVRGLLCRHCNVGLGFYEREGWADSAAKYLSRYEGNDA